MAEKKKLKPSDPVSFAVGDLTKTFEDVPIEVKSSRAAPYNWKQMTVAELVRFRKEITDALPPLELSKMNLEEEMLLQYHSLRELQGRVMEDDEIPVNQRAQVANTVASTLKTIGDQQITLYSSERFKEIENLVIRCLMLWPEEAAAKFMTEYENIRAKFSRNS